jgi:hypothetical protein
LLLNYKNTVAFYQQSSQETNRMYTLNFEVGYSLTNIFSYQTGQSSTIVYFIIFTFICSENMPLELLFENADKRCADLLIVRVLFIEG